MTGIQRVVAPSVTRVELGSGEAGGTLPAGGLGDVGETGEVDGRDFGLSGTRMKEGW